MLLKIAMPDGREKAIESVPGQKLSEAIWLSEAVAPRSICAGIGLCGRCRVRFPEATPEPCPEDRQRLTPDELERGWRLACHHFVPECAELRLILPDSSLAQAATPMQCGNGEPAFVGIDFGTTSIEWQAATEVSPIAAHGSMPNPQGGAGADVMARLAYARKPAGLGRLSRLALNAIARILAQLAANGLVPERICIAANSVMTEILLGCDIDGLAVAPYALAFKGGCILDLELPDRAAAIPTVFPPLPAPFIGGDIAAGLLAVADLPRPFLLIDLGTNAEFALLTQDSRLYLASAPLGPALEGIGPACGQPAGPGVITGFELAPAGLAPLFYDEETPAIATGISASGYISLLAILLNLGLLSPAGHFNQPQTPLAAKIAVLEGENLLLPHGQHLAPTDIETLLKVKAAFRLILERILKGGGIPVSELAAVCLGGALGKFVNIADLIVLGFLPGALADKTTLRGNTSLLGACLLAAEPEKNEYLCQLCQKAVVISNVEDADFMAAYLAAMHWGSHAA